MFVIEDDLHADDHGEFESLQAALLELQRRSRMPYDQEPNRAPCIGWNKCGRHYEVVEYETTQLPWKELRRIRVLEAGEQGEKWIIDPEALINQWA